MPVIAVVNFKGGSGKSTLATHLAAWLARQGLSVMLGDMDRQQSARTWLARRDLALPRILPWTVDQKGILRPPPGVTHVVLDTPGGMHGFDLAKVIMAADAVVIPVCNSFFDRDSAASCLSELMALPRVASKRCRIGVVGMRVDARTHSAQILRDWALSLQVLFLGVLRETQVYVRSLESGLTVFDLTGSTNRVDLDQWEPILQWLRPIVKLESAAHRADPSSTSINGVKAASIEGANAVHTSCLLPVQEAQVHRDRLSTVTKAHYDRPVISSRTQTAESANLFRPACNQGSGTLI